MAKNLVEKLINEAIAGEGTYAEFIVTAGNIAFISDAGTRKSTRNYKLDDKDIGIAERTLKKIDEKSLLFTGKICRIAMQLLDGRNIEFTRIDYGQICIITGKKVTESNSKEYYWVKFTDEKNVRCGVAFALKQTKEKYAIQSCKGSILNGAFDSGISTDLQFVMSGDFYGKSDLPDMKYIIQNDKAVACVARVLEKAITSMFHLKLLGMDLYATLPSTMDEDTEINTVVINATKRAFQDRPMFRTRKGTIVGKNWIMLGTGEVTKLFPQDLIDPLFDGKYWIENCTEGSREEYFLIDIGLPYYDRERFLWEIFTDDNLDELSKILDSQKDKWLRQFYIFCSEPVAEEKIKRRMVTALKNMRSIRDSKGKMRFPHEVTLPMGDEDITGKSVLVRNGLIFPSGKEDEFSTQIRDFFINELAIKIYSPALTMKKMAEDMMEKKQPIDQLYCNRLLTIAKYQAENPDEIDFSEYSIFPYESSRGVSRARANELVVGKPYVSEGNLIAAALDRKSLWKGLKKILPAEGLPVVLDFAESCGAVGSPRIVKQKAEKHVKFSENLYSPGRQGARDSNYDYTIPGLDEMLRRRSLQLIRLVWFTVMEYSDPASVLYAEYSVDNRDVVRRDESSLIKILKERTWVPGKDGRLYMPGNITLSDIDEEFPVNRRNAIIKQIDFGSEIKKRQKNVEEMSKLLKREGLRVVSEEEYQAFLEWKSLRRD